MIEYDPIEQSEDPEAQEISVKVIGVGGAGANILDRMALEGSDEVELLTLNTDMRALSTSVSSQTIQLGSALLKGMGAGGDPDLGQQSALEAVDQIREAVRGTKMIFVCVGLGGGTGSGAAPEVCRIAKEEGVFLAVFATLPFSFEGDRRMNQALAALRKMGKYANAIMTFENDRMGELIVPKDGVTQAFAAADKIISQSIRAITNVVHRPGIIRLGMDDLLTSLDSEHSRCLFGFGQAKGEDRASEAVEQALNCPLLDHGKLLNDARSVLVQVAGGDSMTLNEVQTVMEQISRHIGNESQIMFGTGTDHRLGNSLTVTVISSVKGPKRAAVEEEEADREKEFDPLQAAAGDVMESTLAAALAAREETGDQREGASQGVPVPAAPAASQAPGDVGAASAIYEPIDMGLDFPDPGPKPEKDLVEKPKPAPEVVPKKAPKREPEIVGAASDLVSPAEKADKQVDLPKQPSLAKNPIAAAVQGETASPPPTAEPSQAPDVADEFKATEPAAQVQESPPPSPRVKQLTPSPVQPKPPSGDRIEAKTADEETITLSRIVSEGKKDGVQTMSNDELPPAGPVVQPLAPQSAATTSQTASPEAKQQQEMLQLDPVVDDKGRFSKSDPTIIDGEDLDVPTFLRRKKK